MRISLPASPVRVLLAMFPIRVLLRVFPVPLIAVVPVNVRFSILVRAARLKVTED